MADIRSVEVFQERVKSLLGSFLEAMLKELTDAYRESMSSNRCERCANNDGPQIKNIQDKVLGDSQPLMSFQCCDPVKDHEDVQINISPCPSPEPLPVSTDQIKDIQFTVTEDKIIQTTSSSVSDSETFSDTPKASLDVSVMTEPDVKQECEDVAVMTKPQCESTHLELTQACQTSCESQLKPQDNKLPEESSGGYFSSVRSQITNHCLVNAASTVRLVPMPKEKDIDFSFESPLRACSVLLQRSNISQKAGGRFHVCSVCDKVFNCRRSLKRHRRIHRGKKPYSCSMCSKAFFRRQTLRKHKRSHYQKPFSCTQCGKRFRHWRKLRLHWRSHKGESPFICSRCGEHFRTLQSLDWHLDYVIHF